MSRKLAQPTLRSALVVLSLGFVVALGAASPVQAQDNPNPAAPNTRLTQWQRGFSIDRVDQPDMRVYVWFYEWQLFDAVERGQMTGGVWNGRNRDDGEGVHVLPTELSQDMLNGWVEAPDRGLRLEVKAVDDGAELTLTATNKSDYDWPPLAAVIPCFNPGPEETRNKQFANAKTYFHGADGLQLLATTTPREMHFNHQHRAAVDAEADADGRYAWDFKWPKSRIDAVEGLIVRESTDGQWVAGIAWDRFLTVQGHNPWECMHQSVHLGPLQRGETRTVRGRIYLFRGTKEDVLMRYKRDFGAN